MKNVGVRPITREQFEEHLRRVAAGPRSEQEIAEAERRYRARIADGRAELAAAEFNARRPPGAAPLSRMTGLRASAPAFGHDLAELPEIPVIDEVSPAKNGNGKEPPLDRDMLKALGALFVEVKKDRGRAAAWEEIVDALMVNLHRLAPGWGTVKDIIGLARSLDEYSNPGEAGKAVRSNNISAIRKSLLMEEKGEK